MKIRNMQPKKDTGGDGQMETLDEDMDEEQVEEKVQKEHLQIMKDSMTVYRSSMLYMTFIAILAVDFHVFPRRFAKTEVTGYGLMDLGAGSFVVAAGLVSRRARLQSNTSQSQQESRRSLGRKDAYRILPLLLLGFIRLATNKGLEYQEHVSEYGVHWNFFFTLAIVTPLGAILPGRPNWAVPISILTAYQMGLTHYGGQDFIENAARTHCSSQVLSKLIGNNSALLQQLCTLFAANREGVMGSIGYLSMYLFGECIAYSHLWTPPNQRGSSQIPVWLTALGLWTLLYILVDKLGIVVSRRSTNASFCVWTLAHSMVLLAAIYSAMYFYENPRTLAITPGSSTTSRPRVPVVFQAVNRHGFLAFLVANLLTGLTNLSINTLAVNDALALLILFLYLCAVGGFSVILHFVLEGTGKNRPTPPEKGVPKAKKE